jgi:sulfite reductase (NADPH) hemoprotein beta-component
MLAATDFDLDFVRRRAAQYRDQLERWQRGELSDEQFRPLRLQNGWYVQRYAPMLRVAVPWGELSAAQLRVLARVAREFDRPDPALFTQAQAAQDKLDAAQHAPVPQGAPRLGSGYGHFTTRQNVQFNWIPLERSADVMDLLATVGLHGIQTSGNCIRNITSDSLAGIAADEVADPRPWCELIRQWSTVHPEFAFLPRKFKIAVTGAAEDRAATLWHDVGLQLKRDATGELGFAVYVGGGMGRTPLIATLVNAFVPALEILNYLEAVLRTYNRFGRRDNIYKARIKILVKAEGQAFVDAVQAEYAAIVQHDGAPARLTQAQVDAVTQRFAPPPHRVLTGAHERVANILRAAAEDEPGFARWLARTVHPLQDPLLRGVTLSFKRMGQAPGDATADQLDAAAALAERFSAGVARVTHQQNLLLPHVHCADLPELWRAARKLGLAREHVGLVSDMIACPGGDYCALANARSLPLAAALTERFADLDELHDLGPIDLHISGCINSCGHHHSGHIGILGVDKDGQEWYQVTLGGSDGSSLSGHAQAGRVIGPSFSAHEVLRVVDAVLDTYRHQRQPLGHAAQGFEAFIDTVRRIGVEPFKAAAAQVRLPATA